jgi:UMF1 family MFS transporter
LTLRFLVAYLLYNDGVQTVIAAAAVFGSDELGLDEAVLIQAILVVQFVAFIGALLLERIARRIGAKRTVLGALVLWTAVIGIGRSVPAGDPTAFTLLAVAIGSVLGGTQALSRSMFSQLVPAGREGEYFGLYQISERGTAWIGTLSLGLAVQLTGSYRSGILVLLVFFVTGGALLATTDLRRAIAEAGNEVPDRV